MFSIIQVGYLLNLVIYTHKVFIFILLILKLKYL